MLRIGPGLCARLGSESSSAHLSSENIINETMHKRRRVRQKRPEEKVRRRKTRTQKCHTKKYHGTPETTNLSCFRTEQRQHAASGGKILALCSRYVCTCPGRRSPTSCVVSVRVTRGGEFLTPGVSARDRYIFFRHKIGVSFYRVFTIK